MKIKLFLFANLTLLLSSCCWLVKYDCAELTDNYTIPVHINYTDSVINVDDPLSIKIESSAFQQDFDAIGYDESSFSINITWFDGNFSSLANHKVDLLASNLSGFTLEEYNGYYGSLPSDIEISLGFTFPGYYLIQFYGNANKYDDSKRRNCGCGNYLYQNFQFESNLNNDQFFNLYQSATQYGVSLESLNQSGAYFIKVE